MKSPKTEECICELVAVAFGNKERNNKSLDDAVRNAHHEIDIICRMASFRELKKVDYKDSEVINGGLIFTVTEPICPVCSESVEPEMRYCASCGQALDWSESDE